MSAPRMDIPIGVIIERSKSASQWADFYWRPAGVLTGVPDTPAWSKLSEDGERAVFYAGAASVELHKSDTAHYRDNLASKTPLLWIVLRPTDRDPPYALAAVTADPFEGEAMTEGNTIVDTVPMPESIQAIIGAFVAEHHVEQTFEKRKRDRSNPEALGRHGVVDKD